MRLTRPFTRSALIAALLLASVASSAQAQKLSADKEKELIAVLRSEAPSADKAIACKRLAVDGSSAAVEDIAKLLTDPQLSSWARIALENIPGAESADALKKATETLKGQLLVGTINSIGVRRDATAVDVLTAKLQDKDADVASAAAVALGRVGNADAEKALRAALTAAPDNVRSAVAEGCVLCAERLNAGGKTKEAIALYDDVRKAEVPKQRFIEATRGAILARGEEGLPLLVEQLASTDRKMFQLALGTAREFPGKEVDKALAAELSKTIPQRAALIIQAMADRPETVDLAVVLKAAGSGAKEVRISAVGALARIGNETCLQTLFDAAVDDDAELSQAAKATLADLSGEKINAQIAALLPKAQGKSYQMLIELVGQRRISATPALLKALDSSDKGVRSAALVALGETVDLKGLSILISQVMAAKSEEDGATAQQALKSASVRMPDQDACVTELAAAMEKAPAATKVTLLEIIADVGGAKALKTLGSSAKSNDPVQQDASSRVLGKWNNVDAAPVLIDLAKTGPAQYRVRSLRGYIGLVRKFAMPDKQRAEMAQTAFDLSTQAAEQKLVLDVCKLHANPETLKVVIKARQVPELKDDATTTAVAMAKAMSAKGVDVKDQMTKAGIEVK